METADFKIISEPSHIALTCPYCGDDITIPWESIKPPSYWGDPWEPVECLYCGHLVELGELEYD